MFHQAVVGRPCRSRLDAVEFATAAAEGETNGDQTMRVPAFPHGAVRLLHRHGSDRPAFDAPDPRRVSGASVTFEPGARTAWHTHPLGQTLIVTAGFGSVQRWGGPVEEIRPGDVISCPPGEKHWHGATPTTAMTYIAIQEKLDGKAVEWMEKVTDEQYRGRIRDQRGNQS
jgi:quercetin dioxygenase-like cupin family protein